MHVSHLKILFWMMLVLVTSNSLLACPNCKDGLLDNGLQGANLARGFELSIYLMLGTPVMIFCGLGLLFYLQLRKAQANPEVWLEANHGIPVSQR